MSRRARGPRRGLESLERECETARASEIERSALGGEKIHRRRRRRRQSQRVRRPRWELGFADWSTVVGDAEILQTNAQSSVLRENRNSQEGEVSGSSIEYRLQTPD